MNCNTKNHRSNFVLKFNHIKEFLMKKFLIILSSITGSLLIILYLSFLFVLPNVLDLNKYKADLSKILLENAKISLHFKDAKLLTTPLFGVGVKVSDITIKLPDNSTLFSADSLKTRVALPSLLLLTVKVSNFEVENPYLNLEIQNDKQYKIVQLVEDLINENKKAEFEKKDTKDVENTVVFDPSILRIKVPKVSLKNYKIVVNDLKNKHFLKLEGDLFEAGYFNGKTAKVKGDLNLYSDENKNVTANFNIKSFLPKFEPTLDSEDDPAQRVEIPFVNAVKVWRNYDLKANVDTKLRIRKRGSKITSFGHFFVDDLTLKLDNIRLPKSYMHIKTFGSNVQFDTDLNIKETQSIKLLGKVKYDSHPKAKMNVKTTKIYFNDLVILSRALLNSLQINHELNSLYAKGFVEADCDIKTNFKKLRSNGFIKVKDGAISIHGLKNVLNNANINLLFDDNALTIDNSSLFVNNSKVNLDGFIDKTSNTNLTVKADEISLPALFYAFSPSSVAKQYNFKSGNLKFDLSLKGKLKKAQAEGYLTLSNLNFADSKNTFVVSNKLLSANVLHNKKALSAGVTNENMVLNLPAFSSKIALPKLEINLLDDSVEIVQNSILFNNNSKFDYRGQIEGLNKPKNIEFIMVGSLLTKDAIRLIGKDFEPFVHHNGQIPIEAKVNGNHKKATLNFRALTNANNFITPVEFKEIIGKEGVLQAVLDFKPKRVKIKDTGYFTRVLSSNEKGEPVEILTEILGVNGTVAGDTINLLKMNMPKKLEGKIYKFPNSKFFLSSRAFAFGKTASPRLIGAININSLSIPELLLNSNNINLKLRGHNADFDIKNLLLNGSDISSQGVISLLPSKNLVVQKMNVQSNNFDVDKALKTVEAAAKIMPQGPSSAAKSNVQPNIPLVLSNGNLQMKRIKSGDIKIFNTNSRFSILNNNLYLNNLVAQIFDGNVGGNIKVNLLTSLIDVKMQGRNINVEKAMYDAAKMKDTLSGRADFRANISISGATYIEQMKNLKGSVDFNVRRGQFGPFGKIENLIIAENIRESAFFQTALGGVIDSLTKIDTTHFDLLSGHLFFNKGNCNLSPVNSVGNVLIMQILGDYDLIKNTADMKVRAKMTSIISNLLGPIAAINPVNILNSAASLNVVTAKAFSIFCETLDENEMNAIPKFKNSYVDNSAMKFQIVARGDVAKPLTLIKSFKWLATAVDFSKATEFVNSIPEPIEGSEAQTIEEVIAEHEKIEAEKKTVKYKAKHIFDKKEETIEDTPVSDVAPKEAGEIE